MNIVTCGPGQLPPGKVDPGPRPRPPALPAPKVVLEDRAAYSTPAGRWVRHRLDVTNWQSYHPSLFAPAPHLPACGRNTKASRTWVDIYDAVNGHRIYGYCAIGKPEGLRDIQFAVKSGEQAPARIYVRMTDRLTRRTVTSDVVRIPVSRVSASYTFAEGANIDFAAEHWGISHDDVQKNGVMAVRFIHGVAGTTGSAPLRPAARYRDWPGRPEVEVGRRRTACPGLGQRLLRPHLRRDPQAGHRRDGLLRRPRPVVPTFQRNEHIGVRPRCARLRVRRRRFRPNPSPRGGCKSEDSRELDRWFVHRTW